VACAVDIAVQLSMKLSMNDTMTVQCAANHVVQGTTNARTAAVQACNSLRNNCTNITRCSPEVTSVAGQQPPAIVFSIALSTSCLLCSATTSVLYGAVLPVRFNNAIGPATSAMCTTALLIVTNSNACSRIHCDRVGSTC
jgi:hypothetical protein